MGTACTMTDVWLTSCWLCLVVFWMMTTVTSALECDAFKLGANLTRHRQHECLVQEMFDPSKYSPLVRPVKNINDTITVQISVQLSQIVTIDEKNQVMKTNVWLQVYWSDYQLVWKDKDKYNGVTILRIRPDYVWTPDIVLFNNADGNYEVSYRSNALVMHDGTISWIPPAIYKSSCSMDVTYFPFDEQVCDMKFGSWTFLDHQLNFTFYKKVPLLDVSDYLLNGAWDIREGGATMETVPSGKNDGQNKTMVIFRLVLRRKTLFYTVNLIIPCILISFASLSVFILPADAGEKITLCISILLALVVFLLLISKILPPSLTIPLVSQYLLFTFIMNILCILCTVIVINRNYRTPRTHQMPYWVRFIFLCHLPRLLVMKRPDHEERWQETIKQVSIPNQVNRDPDLTHAASRTLAERNINRVNLVTEDGDTYMETHHSNCRLNSPPQAGDSMSTTETTTSFDRPMSLSPEVIRAAESLKFIHKHLKKDDEYHTAIDDWKYVASVVDRLLLLIFLLVTVIGTVGIYLKAPHLFKSIDQDKILDDMVKVWEQAKRT